MKTWYPAIARSAPYVNPYRELTVVRADIVQKTQIKEAQEVYLPCLAPIDIGDTITCEWHNGLMMYKEIRTINQDLHTDQTKCSGGFYTVNILPTDI